MNAASLVKQYSRIIENIISELDTLESFEANDLMFKLNALQNAFKDLAKLTNAGRGTSELRTEKLKILKKWLQDYSKKEEFLLQTVPQKLKNKTVAIDNTTLDRFQQYAENAIYFIDDLKSRYKEIEERVIPLLTARKELFKNVDDFEIPENELLALAQQEDEIEATVHSPQRTIIKIRAILKRYNEFVTATEAKEREVMTLVHYFENIFKLNSEYTAKDILHKTYSQLNRRNRLVTALVRNIGNLKKTIQSSNFTNKEKIFTEYQVGLEEIGKYLPIQVVERLSLAALAIPAEEEQQRKQTQIEMELAKSPGQIRKYDPLKDPEMNWPKPENKKPLDEDKSPEVKPVFTPTYPDTTKLPELPKGWTTKEDKDKYQKFWDEGEPVDPMDKKKYEQLWETADSHSSTKKLVRLANYLENKYS